jgi:hypothetical protein
MMEEKRNAKRMKIKVMQMLRVAMLKERRKRRRLLFCM